MADFDLFNGDADGIFSLLQMRQVDPRPDAQLVTGVKRDTQLFARIADRVSSGDRITALDWAICGAYGDNFQALAARVAADRNLNVPLGQLRELGELVNYNAYGLTLDDLHFHPTDLYAILANYPDPMAFLEDSPKALDILRQGHRPSPAVFASPCARRLRDPPAKLVTSPPNLAAEAVQRRQG